MWLIRTLTLFFQLLLLISTPPAANGRLVSYLGFHVRFKDSSIERSSMSPPTQLPIWNHTTEGGNCRLMVVCRNEIAFNRITKHYSFSTTLNDSILSKSSPVRALLSPHASKVGEFQSKTLNSTTDRSTSKLETEKLSNNITMSGMLGFMRILGEKWKNEIYFFMCTCAWMHPGGFRREQKVIGLHWTCMVSPASVLLNLWFPARCLPSLYTWINLCCQPTPWLPSWALLEDREGSSLEKFKYGEIQILREEKDFSVTLLRQ